MNSKLRKGDIAAICTTSTYRAQTSRNGSSNVTTYSNFALVQVESVTRDGLLNKYRITRPEAGGLPLTIDWSRQKVFVISGENQSRAKVLWHTMKGSDLLAGWETGEDMKAAILSVALCAA